MNMHRIAFVERKDPQFSRKSYIDGVAYMLMALPDNLSDQEADLIRDSLPPSCNLVDDRNGWNLSPEGRTALQQCVASLVAAFVVLMHSVLSFVAIAFRAGAQYDRKHKILQHIIFKSLVIATAVGRHSVILSAKICAMSDGRVCKAMSNAAVWTVENVTYSIQDGIGQGLQRISRL
jgi:hypothetical protein